jgi:hypothetical protein
VALLILIYITTLPIAAREPELSSADLIDNFRSFG